MNGVSSGFRYWGDDDSASTMSPSLRIWRRQSGEGKPGG